MDDYIYALEEITVLDSARFTFSIGYYAIKNNVVLKIYNSKMVISQISVEELLRSGKRIGFIKDCGFMSQ